MMGILVIHMSTCNMFFKDFIVLCLLLLSIVIGYYEIFVDIM